MKRIAILGDSITEGVGASDINFCFANRLKDKFEVLNYGIGGTRIARQNKYYEPMRWNWAFVDRVKIMDFNVDNIIVFGGTNDFGHGDAEIYGEGEDIYTFTGAIRFLIHYLSSKIDNNKILFILPLRRYEEECGNKKLIDYVNALEKVLKEEGIKYLDLYHNGLPKPVVIGDEYFVDGLHPNDNGHLYLKNIIEQYLINDK